MRDRQHEAQAKCTRPMGWAGEDDLERSGISSLFVRLGVDVSLGVGGCDARVTFETGFSWQPCLLVNVAVMIALAQL